MLLMCSISNALQFNLYHLKEKMKSIVELKAEKMYKLCKCKKCIELIASIS